MFEQYRGGPRREESRARVDEKKRDGRRVASWDRGRSLYHYLSIVMQPIAGATTCYMLRKTISYILASSFLSEYACHLIFFVKFSCRSTSRWLMASRRVLVPFEPLACPLFPMDI